MMKPIQFEVNETPISEHINNKGEYVFGIYTSNQLNNELEKSIEQMVSLWKNEDLDCEINMTINVAVRDIYRNLLDMYTLDLEKIGAEDAHLFDALKNDCQWIVDQINALERMP